MIEFVRTVYQSQSFNADDIASRYARSLPDGGYRVFDVDDRGATIRETDWLNLHHAEEEKVALSDGGMARL